MGIRRTHPGYLSDAEASRESERTSVMVRGFLNKKPATRIGETANFAVDFDSHDQVVFVYGKEIPKECPFKLGFNEIETTAIIDLLEKAKGLFNKDK